MRALGLQSVTLYEMCTAAIRASSHSSLEGVQKINDLLETIHEGSNIEVGIMSEAEYLGEREECSYI